MYLHPFLCALRDRPGNYLVPARFDTFVAMILGYDLACVGGLLVGFREWLVVRLGDGNNLQWPGLVLEIAFAPRYSPAVLDENDDKIATKCLFQLLEEFSIEAHSRSDLTHIYTRYQKWLESQDWYDVEAFAK